MYEYIVHETCVHEIIFHETYIIRNANFIRNKNIYFYLVEEN